MNPSAENYLVLHRFGSVSTDFEFVGWGGGLLTEICDLFRNQTSLNYVNIIGPRKQQIYDPRSFSFITKFLLNLTSFVQTFSLPPSWHFAFCFNGQLFMQIF